MLEDAGIHKGDEDLEWSAPKANSAVTVDSEHNSALDGLSQKKKWKNTETLNKYHKNELIKWD